MQLTKENIAALRKRLMAVRKRGKEYLTRQIQNRSWTGPFIRFVRVGR